MSKESSSFAITSPLSDSTHGFVHTPRNMCEKFSSGLQGKGCSLFFFLEINKSQTSNRWPCNVQNLCYIIEDFLRKLKRFAFINLCNFSCLVKANLFMESKKKSQWPCYDFYMIIYRKIWCEHFDQMYILYKNMSHYNKKKAVCPN